MFIEVYKEWKPTEVAKDEYYPREPKNTPDNFFHSIATEAKQSVGHPFRLIRGLLNVVSAFRSNSVVD